jgi:hypothetical protein
MADEKKKYPNLEEVARTIAADLKCEMDVAMDHAIKGVAKTAQAAGIQVSKNPTADEVEQILAKHLPKLEMFTAQVQRKAQAGKKAAPPAPRGKPKH